MFKYKFFFMISMSLPKGSYNAIGRGFFNSLVPGRTTRYKKCKVPTSAVIAIAHPDDEIAILPLLNRLTYNPNTELSVELFTNGTQGYESELHGDECPTRDLFALKRQDELRQSLDRIGIQQSPTALLDERLLYEQLISPDPERIEASAAFAIRKVRKRLEELKPSYIFVNDFAGGHIVHDWINFIYSQAIRGSEKLQDTHLIEFWQAFARVQPDGQYTQIIGNLGDDGQGRVVDSKGRYTLTIPQVGIKKGRYFVSGLEMLGALAHKKVYDGTQKTSLDRLTSTSSVERHIDAPHAREIDVKNMDHTQKPSQGCLYEQANWRLRGLKRLPVFDDFKRAVELTQDRY
jgi:LmbE family N-acetylglucosaminyl deacetylase